MIKFTRCPKCRTLYELEGVNYTESGGWVQCGECDRKFKATSHAVEPDELSFTVSNYAVEESMKIAGAVAEEHVEESMKIIDNSVTQDKSMESFMEDDELVDENAVQDEQLVHIDSESEDSVIKFLTEDDREQDGFSVEATINKRSQDIEQQQLSQQTQTSDSEFLEKTIILPEEITDDQDFDNILNNYSDDIFSPELIEEEEPKEAPKKRIKNAYAELHSEFSEEEIIVESSFSEKSILEEELETSTARPMTETISQDEDGFKTINIEPHSMIQKVVPMLMSFMLMLGLVGLFALQVHGRGTYQWIPQKNYEGLLSRFPLLTKLEKTQTDLSAIHLASTRMDVNPEDVNGRVISLQLVNRSFSNQAYPDFQLEFTDAKGEIIARRVVFPSLYLDQDHLGFLESRQAKMVFLNLESLPDGAVGYQIKVVQQSS